MSPQAIMIYQYERRNALLQGKSLTGSDSTLGDSERRDDVLGERHGDVLYKRDRVSDGVSLATSGVKAERCKHTREDARN